MHVARHPFDNDEVTDGERNRILALLGSYGVDIDEDSTLLGSGAYKEVHETNISGVVMVITDAHNQFERELKSLEELVAMGIPVMTYYTHEKIGPLTFALAQRGFAPPWGDGTEEKKNFLAAVEKYLWIIARQNKHVADLQFLMDVDENPIFNDPLSTHTLFRTAYNGAKYFEARCKDRRSGSYYYVSIAVRERDLDERIDNL